MRKEHFVQDTQIESGSRYERECFADFNKFVAHFDALEEVRGKKNLQDVDGLREALAGVEEWYSSAIHFVLAAGDNEAQEKFWHGVQAQLQRREPKHRRVEDFAKIKENVLRTASLLKIFNVDGAEASLMVGNVEDDTNIETYDVKKEVKENLKTAPERGVAWLAVEVDKLDAELPAVRVQKGGSVYLVGAIDADADAVKRFGMVEPDERCFYVLLNKKDYANGAPNPRTAATARIHVEEWLKQQ